MLYEHFDESKKHEFNMTWLWVMTQYVQFWYRK